MQCNGNFKQWFNIFLIISEAWQGYESKAYGVSNHNLKLQSKKLSRTRDIPNFPTQGWADTAFCTRKRSETYRSTFIQTSLIWQWHLSTFMDGEWGVSHACLDGSYQDGYRNWLPGKRLVTSLISNCSQFQVDICEIIYRNGSPTKSTNHICLTALTRAKLNDISRLISELLHTLDSSLRDRLFVLQNEVFWTT